MGAEVDIRMPREELLELIRLKGWTQRHLAKELDLNEACVSRWLSGAASPTGPAKILMRQWLREARGQLQVV